MYDWGVVAVGHWSGGDLYVGDDVQKSVLAGLGYVHPVADPRGGELPGITAIRIERRVDVPRRAQDTFLGGTLPDVAAVAVEEVLHPTPFVGSRQPESAAARRETPRTGSHPEAHSHRCRSFLLLPGELLCS